MASAFLKEKSIGMSEFYLKDMSFPAQALLNNS
jgi:hypothetical protein